MSALNIDEVESMLKTRVLGRPLRYLATVESTQDIVRDWLSLGDIRIP